MTALSVTGRKMPAMPTHHHPWHPWRALRRMTHIKIEWRHLDGQLGTWDDETQTITLHPGQSQAERRCTATHEVLHAERGDPRVCDVKTERRVEHDSARRLITHEALVDKLRWTLDEEELAEELWVDRATVVARLRGLSDAEHADIYRRLWGDGPR